LLLIFRRQKVVVVGGNISAADIVTDLHAIVKGPLYTAQRGLNEKLISAWNLPGVVRKPQLKRVFASPTNGKVSVEFSDGEVVADVDKIIFATGFRVAYPFIQPNNPVTLTNRLDGVYEHIVKIGDPSLAFVGQVLLPLHNTGNL
jgi:lysine/ornithine N-monooxygenase